MMASFFDGVRALFGKARVEREMDEELDGYLDASLAHKRASGMDEAAARRAALVEMGSRNAVKHRVWSSRWESGLEAMLQDLRVSLRMLAKSPGFTLVALLSLALGIGGNTAMFTLIDQVLLKELPVRAPEQLVSFGRGLGAGVLGGIDLGFADMAPYDFARAMETKPGPFEGVAAYDSGDDAVSVRLAGAQGATQATVNMVSGNYFRVMGAEPLLGRAFTENDETREGADARVVVSHHYWEQVLASDPNAPGKTIAINGTTFTVIGVMPKAFHGIREDLTSPDMWAPLTMQPQITLQPSMLEPRSYYFLHLFGREQVGANRNSDQQWLDARVRDYIRAGEGASIPLDRQQEINRAGMKLVPAMHGVSRMRAQYGDSLKILMGVVGVVLLIACANLANFVLARSSARQREIATRLALGSSRARIVCQGLMETFVLALTGGLLGLGVAFAATRALIAFVAAGSDATGLGAAPNVRVLAFTFVVSIATGLLFGFFPSLAAARKGAAGNLSAGARTAQGGERGTRFWPMALVCVQVMFSLLLLVGAGLFLRTLENLQNQNYGFERTHLLLARFDARLAGYKPAGVAALNERLLTRLQALPGVRGVALSRAAPISQSTWNLTFKVPGYTPAPKEDLSATMNSVSGRYFETVGISMVAGRALTADDTPTGLKAVVVNETLARHFFPNGDAVGRSLTLDDDDVAGPWQIVGIARDTHTGSPREAQTQRMIYLPLQQIAATYLETGPGEHKPLPNEDVYAGTIELRTTGDPAAAIRAMRTAVADVDANLPLQRVRTMEEEVNGLMTDEALISRLTSVFSLLAVVLAGIGLYGVMSYNVVRRTSEIGIRLAMGARLGDVRWMVMRESLLLLGVGVGLGLPLTFAGTRLIQKQLFGLGAVDPLTVLVALVVVCGMTLMAAWVPAVRATRIDPMVALRTD